MNGAVVVAAREFAERRVVIWAAIAAGFLPLVSPLLPGIRVSHGSEAREVMCLILTAAFCVGASVLVGAGVIAKDLSEGRMGFDFSRPIGAAAIWAGRFAGSIALIAVAVLIVALPTVLAGWIQPAPAGAGIIPSLGQAVAVFAAAILCLVPIAHAASVAFRSRTSWLGLDLIAVVIVAIVVGALAQLLMAAWALRLAAMIGVAFAVVTMTGLWIASVAQVVAGRTDIKRGHRSQSLTLWGIVFSALAVATGYVGWVLRAGPHDLQELHSVAASSGPWVFVEGPARGRGDFCPSFLVHTRDGRVIRLGGSLPWDGGVDFSEDGRRAVWLHTQRSNALLEVWVTDLDTPHPQPRRSTVDLPNRWARYEVAPDGRRLAVLDGKILSIHDLDSGAVIASVRLDTQGLPATYPYLRFQGNGTLRAYFLVPHLEIYEIDVARRSVVRTAIAEGLKDCFPIAFSSDGERLVLRPPTKETLILDARTATVLAVIPASRTGRRAVAVLHDGRFVVGERGAERALVRIFSRDGLEERSLEIDRNDLLGFGGESEPGHLLVTFGERPENRTGLNDVSTALLDLATGSLRAIADDRTPAVAGFWLGAAPAPGSEANDLFFAEHGLVRIDPQTRKETVIAGRLGS